MEPGGHNRLQEFRLTPLNPRREGDSVATSRRQLRARFHVDGSSPSDHAQPLIPLQESVERRSLRGRDAGGGSLSSLD